MKLECRSVVEARGVEQYYGFGVKPACSKAADQLGELAGGSGVPLVEIRSGQKDTDLHVQRPLSTHGRARLRLVVDVRQHAGSRIEGLQRSKPDPRLSPVKHTQE